MRLSASHIFFAVVVLPEPEGPDNRTTWEFTALVCSATVAATSATFLLKIASHSHANPIGSVLARSFMVSMLYG